MHDGRQESKTSGGDDDNDDDVEDDENLAQLQQAASQHLLAAMEADEKPSKYTDEEILAFVASGEQLIDEQADAVVAYNIRRAKQEYERGLPFTEPEPLRRIMPSLQHPFRLGRAKEEVIPEMTAAQQTVLEGVCAIVTYLKQKETAMSQREWAVSQSFGVAVATAL
jgi:hypothetical protein